MSKSINKVEVKKPVKDAVTSQQLGIEVVDNYEIYRTTNYDIFKKLEGNRDLIKDDRIIKSIKNIGYIDNPIIVNEKLEVIDGQNRLEALKKLGLPVEYHIVNGIGIKEARQLNIGQKNWTPLDYTKSNADSGVESYVKLLKFYDESRIEISALIQMSKSIVGRRGGISDLFKTGGYIMSKQEEKILTATVPWIVKNKNYFKEMKGNYRLNILAFAYAYNVAGIDKSRLTKLLVNNFYKFLPYDDAEECLKQISAFYNKGMKTSEPIRLDYLYVTGGVKAEEE